MTQNRNSKIFMQNLISSISYIIGFREANPERKAALVFVIKKLRYFFPDLEILIVEQDEEPKLSLDAELNVKKVFVYNPGLYNRCWAFNVGINHTAKSVLVFADSDIFLEKQDYLSCFQAAIDFEAITPNMTEAINVKIPKPHSFDFQVLNKRELFTFAGGLLILTRQGFMKIGGWDERFEGWGGEDQAISHAIFGTLTSKTFFLPMYHIDHPRSELDGKQQLKYQENRNLAEEISSTSGPSLSNYINSLKKKRNGNPGKYSENQNLSKDFNIVKDLTFVLAVTTYNRSEYLKVCINSFLQTKNEDVTWQLIIADDGSTDETEAYLSELQYNYGATIIRNDRTDIHHQVNTILKYLSNIEFDLCFKCDDDIIFRNKNWDIQYWNAIQRTGYQHLVFYDKNWKPSINLDRPITYGQLISNCQPQNIQGAFYTLTKDILQEVGYFDTHHFGRRGLGHIDFSFRCCRAGFNVIDHPFDIKDSNDYIQLQGASSYTSSLSSKYKSILNSKEVLEHKKKSIRSNRVYIPYNEIVQNIVQEPEQSVKSNDKKNKSLKTSSFKKADPTFYPERGVAGIFGFLLKRIYNISIDFKLYFIPRSIKALGKILSKLSVDLMQIED